MDRELDRRKKRAAIVFLVALAFMLVIAGIIVLYLLDNRPV
jgi:hypothetical protein